MGRRLQLREVTEEERRAVRRLAHSRTAPARAVERAQVVLAARAALVPRAARVQTRPPAPRTQGPTVPVAAVPAARAPPVLEPRAAPQVARCVTTLRGLPQACLRTRASGQRPYSRIA